MTRKGTNSSLLFRRRKEDKSLEDPLILGKQREEIKDGREERDERERERPSQTGCSLKQPTTKESTLSDACLVASEGEERGKWLFDYMSTRGLLFSLDSKGRIIIRF